jgi:hypothetical protein
MRPPSGSILSCYAPHVLESDFSLALIGGDEAP